MQESGASDYEVGVDCLADYLPDVHSGYGHGGGVCAEGSDQFHRADSADVEDRAGERGSGESVCDGSDSAAANEIAGSGVVPDDGGEPFASGRGMGCAASNLVHAAARTMEDADEFDSLHVGFADRDGRSGDGGRTCAGGFPGAVEYKPDAL